METLARLGSFAATYQAILAIIIAVAGWIVVHILTLRSQKINLKNQITNEARLKVSEALREYQYWLVDIGAEVRSIATMPNDLTATWLSMPDNVEKHVDGIRTLLQASGDSRDLKWVRLLEDYAILFPYTGECRGQLGERHSGLIAALSDLVSDLHGRLQRVGKGPGTNREILEDIQSRISGAGILSDIETQGRLLEDLLVYLQTKSLGPIVGGKAPFRTPNDHSRPLIVEDYRGDLCVKEPDEQA